MNEATPIPSQIVGIPLADLALSDLNTRQDVPQADIDAMADSIGALGLLQNLSALRTADGIGIVAGGKRLRALQKLAADPTAEIGPDTLVPVRLTDDPAEAQHWASAENEAREDPHPADQIIAYRTQAAQGTDPATIARAFGKTEAHVRGRLALAKLPDSALTALRKGQINLDEAKALTLASDQAQAERVLETGLTIPRRHPGYFRRELAEGRISATDRRAVFVGLDTYRAEGGALTEDLFEGNALLHNEALLDKLFATKLAIKTEEAESAEGWAWAKAIAEPHLPYSMHEEMERLHPTPGTLSEADAAEYDRLADLANADAISDTDLDRLGDLQRRLDGGYTDQQRAVGGVFVYVNHEGTLKIARAYAPRDRSKDGDDIDLDSVDRTETKPKPAITAKGTDDLHTIAALALQTALLAKSELLLDLFAFQLEAEMYAWQAPLNIAVSPQNIAPSTSDGIATDARLLAETEVEGPTPARQFEAFRALGKKHRNTVLTRHLSRSANAPMRSDFGRALMTLAEVDMRKVWTPTAANHFSALSVPALDTLWYDLLQLEDGDDRIAEFCKLKKGEKAKQLEALFSDASVQEAHGLSRDQVKALDVWLPEDFRTGAEQ